VPESATRASRLPRSLQGIYERPLIHKFVKYAMTSVVGVGLGQSLIFLFASILDWPGGWANVTAVAIGTGPTYYISRHWVWQKRGKHSFQAEVIPFWVMTFLGLLLSTIVVVLLENQYPDTKILVNVGNFIGFGVLWIAKFFVLDRMLFKVTHEHPEGPAPFL
jgi:putative flippase GtrA